MLLSLLNAGGERERERGSIFSVFVPKRRRRATYRRRRDHLFLLPPPLQAGRAESEEESVHEWLFFTRSAARMRLGEMREGQKQTTEQPTTVTLVPPVIWLSSISEYNYTSRTPESQRTLRRGEGWLFSPPNQPQASSPSSRLLGGASKLEGGKRRNCQFDNIKSKKIRLIVIGL